ncbi:AtpZ/AtpI family protein [Propionispira raffinosivorans]|uniref:AtpZ/AtpI family protein n=1 Tax=Propionispira raffinosivorans TaxID=86959 RepID=UPI00036BCC49|nr:AtpZ/AtpI family protein [Propionispira raffinosivorans]
MDKKEKKNENPSSKHTTLQALTFVSGIGINFAITVGLFIYMGKLADEYFNIAPKGTLAGIFLGFIMALWVTGKKLLGKS